MTSWLPKTLWLVSLVGIDQYSKSLAVSIKFKEIVPSFLNVKLTENPGVIFGFLSQSTNHQQTVLLIIIGLITIIYFGSLYFKKTLTDFGSYSLGMILSGSIGNIIDRTLNGYVIDFIDFYYKDLHYWTFNFADSFIVIGLIGWFLSDYYHNSKA